ncbi:MAG: RNA polymerase sigma factor [Gammaproteobacteria bacterium]|nr:RNA polymerase sigma factor [Gammaproteobacteria bacterium]
MERDVADEDLMLAYRNGDAVSFDRLYSRHKGAVYRYILRHCRNEAIAEELFQEVWMNLIKARERYVVKAKFTTWLYQIAQNKLIDHYRRQKPGAGSGLKTDEFEPDDLTARVDEQPEQQTQTGKQMAHLFHLLDQLPEEQKQAFLLREEAGMSLDEIAEAMEVNAETAKSRLRYAINKLKQGLTAYDSE